MTLIGVWEARCPLTLILTFCHLAGTPPNLVVLSTLESDYGSRGGRHPLSYASWMGFAVPLMLLNTLVAWLVILVIQRLSLGPDTSAADSEARIKKVITERRRALGRITQHEVLVVILFVILILLWFFMNPRFMPGWAELFNGMTDRYPLSTSCHNICPASHSSVCAGTRPPGCGCTARPPRC